jgi:hypothetical protein
MSETAALGPLAAASERSPPLDMTSVASTGTIDLCHTPIDLYGMQHGIMQVDFDAHFINVPISHQNLLSFNQI